MRRTVKKLTKQDLKRDLHPHVHSSQGMRAPVSTDRGQDKPKGVPPHCGCHSAPKRKGALTPDTTWMDPEDTVLSEMGQSQEDKSCRTPPHRRPPGESDSETGSSWWGPGPGEGWERVFNGDRASVWGDEKVLEMTEVVATQQCDCA